jgi:RNA polymerase sigma factor
MGEELMEIKDRNKFIEENLKFIITTTENICKRKISRENDDEYSIALIAFNKAIDEYDEAKGNFYSFCQRVIRNALIDYFRKVSVSQAFSVTTAEISNTSIDLKTSMEEHNKINDALNKKEVIMSFNKALSDYKISISDLVKSSPSHRDTRQSLIELSQKMVVDQNIMDTLSSKKMLNIKYICSNFNVNRKFVEKWRRYIIALVLILSNSEFRYIKNYLNIESTGDMND